MALADATHQSNPRQFNTLGLSHQVCLSVPLKVKQKGLNFKTSSQSSYYMQILFEPQSNTYVVYSIISLSDGLFMKVYGLAA